MNRLSLKAQERKILGKQVKALRKTGVIPAHIFGNQINTEHISVKGSEFLKVYDQAGETGLIDLKIGEEKVRPVMIKDVQLDPVKGTPLHIDFYQVNLSKKVTVPVPVVIIGIEPELVGAGEAVVIQPLSEIEVEALPAELPEKLEVDMTKLKEIGDAILVSEITVPEGIAILSDPEAVVVKLDTAITEEMKKLMEEQAAEAAAAAASEAPVESETPASTEATTGKPAEGEEAKAAEGETEAGVEKPAEQTEEKAAE